MKPILRGIFLTAQDPAATAKFYQEVARLDLEQIGNTGGYIYWKIDRDGFQLAIHDAAQFAEYSRPARPESNVTHLYFKIENQGKFLGHLKELDIAPYALDDVVVTVEDPDGRKVMFGTA